MLAPWTGANGSPDAGNGAFAADLDKARGEERFHGMRVTRTITGPSVAEVVRYERRSSTCR